jgi:acyl carrier protein
LRSLIAGFLSQRALHVDLATIADDVNLVQSQIIDSMDFVDLLLFLEAETGHQIDFMTIDLERMMSIADILVMFNDG